MTATFTPGRDYHIGDRKDYRVLAFYQDRLVVATNGVRPTIPSADALRRLGLEPDQVLHLGTIMDQAHIGWRLSRPPDLAGKFDLVGLRALFSRLDEAEFQAAGCALQLLNWVGEHRYCGRCGARMTLGRGDRALACSNCGSLLYPRISPAVIVAVTSGDRLLLARSARFPKGRMFSVIAGYVEPGETLEDCVRREVREEVGLALRRIRYFGSQAWPFSGSLMVGFTAEHAAGDIRVDGLEILEAAWFTADRLPEIPGKISIARALIDWFAARRHP